MKNTSNFICLKGYVVVSKFLVCLGISQEPVELTYAIILNQSVWSEDGLCLISTLELSGWELVKQE
jgi:hypothetical protein